MRRDVTRRDVRMGRIGGEQKGRGCRRSLRWTGLTPKGRGFHWEGRDCDRKRRNFPTRDEIARRKDEIERRKGREGVSYERQSSRDIQRVRESENQRGRKQERGGRGRGEREEEKVGGSERGRERERESERERGRERERERDGERVRVNRNS